MSKLLIQLNCLVRSETAIESVKINFGQAYKVNDSHPGPQNHEKNVYKRYTEPYLTKDNTPNKKQINTGTSWQRPIYGYGFILFQSNNPLITKISWNVSQYLHNFINLHFVFVGNVQPI